MELTLPLTATGRKYGYIIWGKEVEADLRRLVGDDTVTLILPGGAEKTQKVDWKHRRISLGYSVTRGLAEDVRAVHLNAPAPGRIHVTFR